MRVLVISAFPPEPAPEAAHAFHIAKHLVESGLSVHVLCKRGSGSVSRDDIVVHPVIKRWDWSDLPALIRCIRSCRPDVVLLIYVDWVFGRHPMITFLPTIVRAVLPNTPCVTQFENMAANEQWRSIGARILRKIAAIWAGQRDLHWAFGALLRDSDHVICLSSPHRARAVRIFPDVEEKSIVLPPPPLIHFCSDPPDVARKRAREAIGVAEDDFVWVYWGYIYAGKGIETLLRAFRIASQRNSNLRLLLVGGMLEVPTEISSSDYFRMVKSLPDVLGIADKVIWTGGFSWDSEAGSLFLHAGDACVLPLDWGITLNNSSLAAASTHGLPVIGTELHQGRDEMLVHGQNVYLVQPRDPAMLAEAMELITECASLRERLRDGIRKLAEKWHRWGPMIDRLIAVLQSARSAASIRGAAQGRPEAVPGDRLSDASRGTR
jgi:glycosyltransferase involved in cell wall biosynthesis